MTLDLWENKEEFKKWWYPKRRNLFLEFGYYKDILLTEAMKYKKYWYNDYLIRELSR